MPKKRIKVKVRVRRPLTKRSARERVDRGEGGRFLPGHGIKSPGNPHAQRIAEYREAIRGAITAEDLRRVFAKLKRLACEGDMEAIRELLNRTIGKASTTPAIADAASLDLPELTDTKSTLKAATVILKAVARGDLSGDDAAKLGALVELARRSLETDQLAERIAALETKESSP